MGDKTTIEWTDATWNPVRGCSIVSNGCTNCYAMRQAHRSSGAGGAYEGLTKLTKGGPVWTGSIRFVEELLEVPLKWTRPRRIFVNSMSDLFHADVHGDEIAAILDVIKLCHLKKMGHVFQVLTKRAARMQAFMKYFEPLPNLWLGVSVEDQAAADERIPLLLQTPAAVRWISAEPLLGPVNLDDGECSWLTCRQRCTGESETPCTSFMDLGHCFRGIDWVVAGGESGPGARPMHPDWARSLRDQCARAAVPFFFKQWGTWLPRVDYYSEAGHRDQWASRAEYRSGVQLLTGAGGEWVVGNRRGDRHDGQPPSGTWVVQRLDKKSSGRELDGRTHDEYPA